ncbi:uncharacterized protein LOC116340565 [Contarinia nasturtii]|uniref:uncharacterized protein LOC116340565 n=1 Tax=Contarinia nasturtii TaxID=265458 RepID=UPI0012D3B90C|nr:uncharacterized protein LOC116340565 [Contarinia nasturtii]
MRAFILLVLVSVVCTVNSKEKSKLRFDVDKDVRFDLYTLNNPTVPQILDLNNINTITESNFKSEVPTRIIIHGFFSNGQLTKVLTDAYFTKKQIDVNLIAVNWEMASRTVNYVAAAGYVPKIGIRTAEFIDFMVANKFMNITELTVIGFSLGAHISGIAGKNVQLGKIPKIVGLDPAFPLFSLDKPDDRLDSEDALYVETIHTSKLGFFDQLGKVSFYCNGGRSQPGCTWDVTGKCSHRTAYLYYAQSIYSEQPLMGYLCDSLNDIKDGLCKENQQSTKAVLGGEPGAFEQNYHTIYHIFISNISIKPFVSRHSTLICSNFKFNKVLELFKMGLILFSNFLFAVILTIAIAKPLESNELILVPTYDGKVTRVNITEAMTQVQTFFDAEQEVTFELFTLKNANKLQILSLNNITSITASNFNKKVPTRFFIHGWQERLSLKKVFAEAYFMQAKVDVNLIYVNWEKSSQTINYIAARNRVEPIGAYVATMIDFLVNNEFASINDINVIGFSLGAHAAGIAGKYVQSGKLPKIVGLDPAGPLFSLDKPNERLDRFDAKYVEVIHTNGAFLGFYNQIGTVSFYPNQGRTQVGCPLDITGVCSHLRAYKYFAESIYSPVSFYGYPCKSMEDMKKGDCKGVGLKMGGEPGNYKAEAEIYYLSTNTKSIFARGGSRDI